MRTKLLLLLSAFFVFLGCQNPFFPRIGKPRDSATFLITPEGVAKELVRVYESKRIDLFKKMIYDESTFRFYIEYNKYKDENLNNIQNITSLNKDNVPFGDYWYLTYNDELKVHEKMFDPNNEIVFTNLEVTSLNYILSEDTLSADIEDYLYYLFS